MTRISTLTIVLLTTLMFSFSTVNYENDKINFDGMYIARTGTVSMLGNDVMEIYNYIRFYDDGTVYTQSVASYDPQAVAKWFGKEGKFERSGSYKQKKKSLSFTVSNNEDPNKNIEGPKTDSYTGKIVDDEKIELAVTYDSGKYVKAIYEFVRID